MEGPRQLVGSSSSELSADTNYRNREQQQQRQHYSDIVVGHSNNCSRQISPASCNSESVASSSAGGTGACGLCSLMPHCAILEGSNSSSAKARKIRGGSTVIVEEELPLPATAETRETVGASSRTLQNVVAANSRPGELLGGGTVGATSARHNSRMSKFNSSSMDRSVDSIGSCSLDVDADSTDFSGTEERWSEWCSGWVGLKDWTRTRVSVFICFPVATVIASAVLMFLWFTNILSYYYNVLCL